MSGGSLNYVFNRVNEAAMEIVNRAETPLHHAFAAHLVKVARALRDIEWLFSCDTSPGDEEQAIRAVLHEAEILAEREACAKVCEDVECNYSESEGHKYPECKSDAQAGAASCAYAIRAR